MPSTANPVSLPESSVEVDLKNLHEAAPAPEAWPLLEEQTRVSSEYSEVLSLELHRRFGGFNRS
jgi:hypothetical protein